MTREVPRKPFDSADWICACAIVFFVVLSCVFIPRLGIEGDEVLFVDAIVRPNEVGYRASVAHHGIPIMLMSYLGSDKAWLYWPILKIFPPSLWTLRLPVVLAGAVGIYLLFTLVKRMSGPAAAVAAVCFIATDPVYLLTNTFDWGPVALQHLFLLAALTCFTRRQPAFYWGGFFVGALLWDKGIAIWNLAALAVSAATFVYARIEPHLSARNLRRAALGFVTGALPFLIFNIRHRGATLGENAVVSADKLSQKLEIMKATLDGRVMFGWMILGPEPRLYSLMPAGLLLAAVLLAHPKVRGSMPFCLFALFTGLLTWGGMLLSRGAGGSAHHTILVWPWPQIFIAAVLAASLRKGAFAVVITILVASNVILTGSYAVSAFQNGPAPAWSDAVLKIPGALPPGKKVITLDWGIENAVRFLTQGKTTVVDRTTRAVDPGDISDFEMAEFLTHSDGSEIITGSNAKFDAVMAATGFARITDKVLKDSRGQPFLVAFHCVRVPVRADLKNVTPVIHF
jgi:hypothetical protein